jgi:soluble lytic murein transglycosylase
MPQPSGCGCFSLGPDFFEKSMSQRNAASAKTVVGVLAVALAALLAACGGDEATPATPTTLPQDTVVTAEATGDLADAQKLQRDGRYEEAIVAYQALVRQKDSPDQREARLGLAQSYFALERHSEAVDQLESYLDADPPDEDALSARFLLGRVYAAQGDVKKAQDNLRRYAEEDGPLAAYARLDLANLLTQEGKADKAIDELEKAAASSLPSTLAPSLLLRLANAYADAGEDDLALQTYDRLLQEAPAESQQALALWGIATVSRRLGDGDRWEQSLFDLVREYPASPQALNALETLTAARITVDLLSQAIVHYQRGAYDEALASLDGFLAGNPSADDSARAHFYKGAIRQDQGALDEALVEYEASLGLDAAGSLASEAAWARADLLEALGRTADAALAYGELWRAHPTSKHAAEAAFRSGFLPFRDGDVVSAQAAWTRTLIAPLGADGLARIHLWLGKAALVLGEGDEATAQFQQAQQAAPDSFSALRAEAWAAGQGTAPLPVTGGLPPSQQVGAPDWAAIEAWLTASFGAEAPAPASPAPTALLRGRELYLLGFRQEAEDEFLAALSESASDPWGLYRLARSFQELDLTHLAARAAGRLIARSDAPLAQAPRPLLELAYPLAFVALVEAAGRENEVSPLLLLALIRQESFYDPQAISVAGALGLTQVIPATGMEIAEKLDLSDFTPLDLLEPSLSIEFGAFYLGDQLRFLDGDLYLALAAYNGGPGNALRWRDDPTAVDADFLVESIDLEETRSYLELVLVNYAVYRFLYGGESHPTLLPT